MNVPGVCIRLPVMTTLVMLGIFGFGLLAYQQLPLSDLPKIDYPTVSVTASLPGADPETMASAVATPLERQFSTIAGIDAMTSSSQRGQTRITIQFALERDIDAAAQDVQAAMAAAQKNLPATMPSPPTWQKVNPGELPILFMALRSETLPLSQVNEYADTLLAQRISMLSGVAQVVIYGAQKPAVRIQVDPDKLVGRDLSLNELAKAVERGNSNLPTGTVWGVDKAWAIQSDAGLKDAKGFRPLVIAWRDGAPVRLDEVAAVSDGVQNDKVAAWFKDTRSIVLAVQRQPGTNTVAIVDAVKALLPRLQAQIPAQVELDVFIDRSLAIRASVTDVQHTLILTAVLVVLVIFVFLRRLSATIIPALSLPLSLVGTFSAMWLLGFNLDNLSLMALTLATGFVVDDAIVVLENIVRRMEAGEDARTASIEGSRQIAFTVLSMTISLLAVFIPVLFMSGILGRLFLEFAVTVMVAIGVSGFVSLTLVPMLCSRFLRPEKENHGWFHRVSERFFEGWRKLYERSLDVALRHPWWVLASLLVSLGISGWLAVIVPKGQIPNEDLGQIRIVTEYSSDISFPDLVRRQRSVAQVVLRNPNVHSFMSSVGNESGNQGTMFLRLKDPPERKLPPEAVIGQLRTALAGQAGVRVLLSIPPQIRIDATLSKAQFQYTLQGADTAELYRTAAVMITRMRAMGDHLTDVSTDMVLDSPRLTVQLDRDRAAALGISPAQFETTLGLAFGAQQISTIYTDTNQYQVILEVGSEHQRDANALAGIHIRPDLIPGAALVPLGAVATVGKQVGPLSINHRGQFPAVTIFFNLRDGVALGTAVERISALAPTILPASVTGSFAGAAQSFQSSVKSMLPLLILSIVVIYLVLGILYESFIHPITILSGLPSAGIGAFIALIVFKDELNVFSFIGLIMLVGIVKKNAIMMVDFAIQARVQDGLDAFAAIRRGCLVRFRPIMMTTMCALMGTLPLAIGLGTVSNSRRSLGIAVVGGLLLSQLITLYITPVVYLLLDRVQESLRRRFSRSATDRLTDLA